MHFIEYTRIIKKNSSLNMKKCSNASNMIKSRSGGMTKTKMPVRSGGDESGVDLDIKYRLERKFGIPWIYTAFRLPYY